MDKAKAAIASHLGHHGEQKTHVHEEVAPAVTSETRNAHAHENVTQAVDRETHQHHYHTSVQPVQHKEVLPEQHHHNLQEVKHTTHDHRDHEGIKAKLEQERAKFQNTSTEGSTVKNTQSVQPSVSGERVHHHIHENIQPVIHKETVQPHVVHTTVPVHETHHENAKHHGVTTLPALGMDEFKKHGGQLGGREVRHDHFDGAPKGFTSDSTTGGSGLTGDRAGHSHTSGTGSGLTGSAAGAGTGAGAGPGLTGHNHGTSSTTGTGAGSGLTGHNHGTSSTTGTGAGSGLTGHNHGTSSTTGAGAGAGSGLTGHSAGHSQTAGTGAGSGLTGRNTTSTTGAEGSHLRGNRDSGVYDSTDAANRKPIGSQDTTTSTTGKPSLMDKLNPMKDSNGDGQKGFMK